MLLREVLPAIFLREDALYCSRQFTFLLLPAWFSGLDGIFATGGILISNTDSNNKNPLTFRIVDSAMGVGKSQCLMEHIRFSASCHPAGVMNERYIIFVPTLSERDERFRKYLNLSP